MLSRAYSANEQSPRFSACMTLSAHHHVVTCAHMCMTSVLAPCYPCLPCLPYLTITTLPAFMQMLPVCSSSPAGQLTSLHHETLNPSAFNKMPLSSMPAHHHRATPGLSPAWPFGAVPPSCLGAPMDESDFGISAPCTQLATCALQ